MSPNSSAFPREFSNYTVGSAPRQILRLPPAKGANSRHALDMAQKLSDQLRAAENRIAELEAEVGTYQQRAERAERWLHKIYTEIEDRFLRQDDGRHVVTGAPKRPAGRSA